MVGVYSPTLNPWPAWTSYGLPGNTAGIWYRCISFVCLWPVAESGRGNVSGKAGHFVLWPGLWTKTAGLCLATGQFQREFVSRRIACTYQ